MRRQAVIVLALTAFAPLAAQQPEAILTGRVLNLSGEAVQKTRTSIHARNTARGVDFTGPVADDGAFRIDGLIPGTYDISVPMRPARYLSFSEKGVTIRAGENKIDVRLKWGSSLGTVADDPAGLAYDMRLRSKVVDGPTPRMPNGKVNFSGMWTRIVDITSPSPNPIPLQPWAAEIQKKLDTLGGDRRPNVYCLPSSAMPFNAPWFPQKLIQTSTVLLHLTEFETPGYRQIFLDDRPHPPKTWNPAWLGHSVGKWDGDTLIVDTVGFNEMAGGVGVHTEKLHVIERLRRPDLGHMRVDITVEDPDAYTKLWSTSVDFQLTPDEEILEFVCAENNQAPLHLSDSGYRHRP
jgi:hypothetical protein